MGPSGSSAGLAGKATRCWRRVSGCRTWDFLGRGGGHNVGALMGDIIL